MVASAGVRVVLSLLLFLFASGLVAEPKQIRELRIGIILYTKPASKEVKVNPWLRRYFDEISAVYAASGIELDIVPVHGNYYQVLQWLREGEIDGAIASSFSAYLLTSDEKTAVFPVIEFSRNAREAAPASPVPATVSATRNGKPLSDAEGVFRDCLRRVAEAVRDPLLTQQCDFRFVTHLSSTGFVTPLLAMEEHADSFPFTEKESDEYWAKVLEWSRFELWHDANVPDRKDITTLHFSYVGSGRDGVPLRMKRRLPVLNDVLLLGQRRLVKGLSWRKDPERRHALLREGGTVTGGRFLQELVIPSVTEGCIPNRQSPWVIAGMRMKADGTRGYQSTSSWCEPQREAFAMILDTRLHSETSRALGRLFQRWYDEGEYAFSVAELIDLLKTDQWIRRAPRAALVLPGGGVRATYQSVILDWLYSHHIANAGSSYIAEYTERATASPDRVEVVTSEIPEDRLVINGIAGTSGGALLGYLASRRHHTQSTELTDAWISKENEVKTTPLAVFPAFGVLRWLSVLVLLGVFAATSAIHLQTISPAPQRQQVPFWYTSLLSIVIIGAPFLIWRNGIDNPTHVVKWETCAMVATLFVGHVLHSVSANDPAATGSRRLLRVGVAFTFLGLLAIYLLVQSNPHDEDAVVKALEESAVWTASSGTALLIVIAGLTLISAARGTRFDAARGKAYLQGWLVLLVLFAGTAAIFFTGLYAGHVTLLELTFDYWMWLFIGALFTSKLIVTTGRVFPAAPLQTGIRYLSSPSGTAPFPYTPTMSLAIWGGLAALVWLIFVAPSLYSGENGRAAFLNAQALNPHARARVPLVVSMTGLGSELPRFESPRGDFYASDDRWKEVRASDEAISARLFALPSHDFQDAVFASGSPFPIYPAAKVQAKPLPAKPGLFLDGGYAHLVPIEAAGLFGAAQILVIENVARQSTASRGAEAQRLGTLTTNLGKAFDFLFERSQDIDLRAQRQAVVGTIAPDWTGPNPFLMDFRQSVILRLKAEALDDLRGHRIARVKSWGQPIGAGDRGGQ